MLSTLLIEELEVFLAELEGFREVFLAHNLVFSELLRSALEEDFSFEEQVGTVGDGECLIDVMVGDEDADVAILQLPDDLLDVFGDAHHRRAGHPCSCAPCPGGTRR